MPVEIERKFLTADEGWRRSVTQSYRIVQGYLAGARAIAAGASRAAVRVRLKDARAWLTVKSAVAGAVRDEYEYAIPVEDAERMLATLCGDVVEKQRHIVPADALRFEIDEFSGRNAGLVVAEIELPDPRHPFPRPRWLGREVTDEARYYNVNLASHPYTLWPDLERHPC